MVEARGPAALVFAVMTGSGLALTIAPAAHADPLAGVRQAVVNARAGSTCSALNYSIALEGEAQHDSGNLLPGVPPAGQYHGTIARFSNSNDPAAAAINGLVTLGPFIAAIDDCSYKDFGVGFYRVNDFDYVSAVLGKPDAPPAPPPPANPSPVPYQQHASAIGNVDVWDIAHDDTPDPVTGVRGAKVGTLTDGQGMVLQRPCDSGWCLVNSGYIVPRGYGFVQQSKIRFD
jgi:hypothetical protein